MVYTGTQTGERAIDRTLVRLAKERAALDAEEARWLCLAVKIEIWREVACSTMLEYVERRLGYAPRTAQERLRVAFALQELPAIAHALETGELTFSGVRELSRVATAETEQAWLGASAGKSVHEIEKLVSGHRLGDLPGDPLDPELASKTLRYEVKPGTAALLREAKRALEKQRGETLDDDSFLAAMAGLALGGQVADDEISIGRAKFQVALMQCDSCKRSWSDVGGAAAPLDAAELDRAMCDAQHLGRIDTDAPARAHQDVSPRTRRTVWRRDRGTCAVPGCRARVNLEIHHVKHRADGGTHEPSGLILLCDGHHSAHHRGTLTIRGKAPGPARVRASPRPRDRPRGCDPARPGAAPRRGKVRPRRHGVQTRRGSLRARCGLRGARHRRRARPAAAYRAPPLPAAALGATVATRQTCRSGISAARHGAAVAVVRRRHLCDAHVGAGADLGSPPAMLQHAIVIAPARGDGDGDDRARVVETKTGLIVALADGAGGTSHGAETAQAIVGSINPERMNWGTLLATLDNGHVRGQSTAVIVEIAGDMITGTSVGDSGAWLVRDDDALDLTIAQHRKPLVGSGCTPVAITPVPFVGTLLVASDGLLRYVKREAILRTARIPELAVAARLLVDLARLPNGQLQDDVAVVLIRR